MTYMDADEDNDGRFPDESAVLTPYPLTKQQEQGNRADWPWLLASVQQQVGPDEWELCIEAREVAKLEDGSLAPEGIAEDDLYHPVVFRDSAEIRPASPTVDEMREIFSESEDEPGPHEPKLMGASLVCIVCGKEHQ